MWAMLTALVPSFTRPTYSAISLGRFPAAVIRVGAVMWTGMPALSHRRRPGSSRTGLARRHRGRVRRGLLVLYRAVDLFAEDPHVGRRVHAEPDLAAADLEDPDRHGIADADHLADLPCQYEHASIPRPTIRGSVPSRRRDLAQELPGDLAQVRPVAPAGDGVAQDLHLRRARRVERRLVDATDQRREVPCHPLPRRRLGRREPARGADRPHDAFDRAGRLDTALVTDAHKCRAHEKCRHAVSKA